MTKIHEARRAFEQVFDFPKARRQTNRENEIIGKRQRFKPVAARHQERQSAGRPAQNDKRNYIGTTA
ncbi:hypothetical protein SAMN05428974_0587 [Sphingopyxis sp. YR583]|uniref:hypothetical protein n=1 Tax=Sphingopyxis sp. YR583 TaxID=1881047 RepID=UPI0008A7A3E6|nr:hypothetical protein [Sphingopyxis sp. YR583]SEH12886.1 hypothetical protein SAMN05428974_0587 [Sphingopyxis sp. YR583]